MKTPSFVLWHINYYSSLSQNKKIKETTVNIKKAPTFNPAAKVKGENSKKFSNHQLHGIFFKSYSFLS